MGTASTFHSEEVEYLSLGPWGVIPKQGTLGLQREGLKGPVDAGRAPGLKD